MFDHVPLRDPVTPGAPGAQRRAGPPGWPPGIPPPSVSGWEQRAVGWLLDQCPADYRGYAGWRRHPLALAWVASLHLDAQLAAMRTAYREVRVALTEEIGPEGVTQVLGDLEAEGVRLVVARRSAHLILEGLQGKEFVPKL